MIYALIRVSTDKQDHQRQRTICDQLAARTGNYVAYWIEETVTGGTPWQERPIGEWLQRAQPGDELLVSEISRIARSLTGILTFIEACAQKGLRIRCASPDLTLDDSIQAQAVAFAFGFAAQIERTLLRERTRTALADRKARGVKLGRPAGKTGSSKLDKNREAITKMLQAKCSLSSIGRAFNCTRQTVARWAAANIAGDVITSDAAAGRHGI